MDEDVEHDNFPDLSRVKMEVQDEDEEITIEDYNPYLQIKEEIDYTYINESEGHHDQQDFNTVCMSHPAPDILGTGFNMPLTGLGMSHGNEDHSSINMSHTDPAMDQSNQDMSRSNLNESWSEVSPSNITGLHNAVIPLDSSPHLLYENRDCSILNTSHQCFNQSNQSWGSNSSSSETPKVLNISNNSLQYTSQIVTEEIEYDETHEIDSSLSKIIISNKLIIGSKPPKTGTVVRENVIKKEFLPAMVVLENWSSILAKSTCYCQSCEILFPTENSLDAHKMTVHSFLVALDRNGAAKSTSVVNIQTDSSEYDSDDNSEIKNIQYETNNFSDVSKQLYPSPKIIRKGKSVLRDDLYLANMSSSKIIQRVPNSVNYLNEMVTGSYCNHCNKIFNNHTALIKHLYSLLPHMYDCGDCKIRFDDEQQYFDHQKAIHLNEQVQQYKCTICNLSFDTYPKAKLHKRDRHIEWNGKCIFRTISINKSDVLDNKTITYQDVTNSISDVTKQVYPSPKIIKKIKSGLIDNTDVENISSLKSIQGVNGINKIVIGHHCNHCNKTFDDYNTLIKHLYTLLPQTTFRSDDCQVTFDDKQQCLNNKKTDNLNERLKLYKCTICHLLFNTYPKAKYHKKTRHSKCNRKSIFQPILVNINKSNISDINSLPYSTKKFIQYVEPEVNVETLNIKKYSQMKDSDTTAVKNVMGKNHSHTVVKEIKNTDVGTLSGVNNNMDYYYRKTLKVKNPPIPIGVLYKCNKCDLHLLNVLTAYNHSDKCTGTIGFVKCNKCNRKFKTVDIELHKLQHLVSKSFKVHLIPFSLRLRVLCRCPKCDICYNEFAYWQHLNKLCKKRFIHCKVCNLKISDKHTYKIHLRYHNGKSEMGLVVVDYFDPVQREIVEKASRDMYKLIYCETCNSCAKSDSRHPNSCKNHPKRLCLYCGLYFTAKAIVTHKKLHIEKKLNLHNFLLFSRTKQKYIQPSVQNFRYCAKCRAHYIGRMVKHKCFSNIINTCNICLKHFDGDIAFKLHVEFHNYILKVDNEVLEKIAKNQPTRKRRAPKERIPVLDKPNVLDTATITKKLINNHYIYQCIKCLEHTRYYDAAVQHAQRHIINKKSPEGIYCKKCKKYFDTWLFKSHDHDFQYYKVLKYDYLNIFNENWFDMFEGLDKVEVEMILKRSLYKDTRCVKVTLIKKADPKFTIYMCQLCNLAVEKNSLAKHVSNSIYCWADSKYKCSTCNIYFFSPGTMKAHEKLHNDGATANDFRVISINNKKSVVINMLLSRVREKAEPKNSIIENFRLYKCKNCKICIEDKRKRRLHNCRNNIKSRRFCNICKQYFPKKNRIHQNRHKGNIKFNVVIEYFEPVKINRLKNSKIIGKNGRKKILNPSNMNAVRFTDTLQNGTDEKKAAISVKDSQSAKVTGYDENAEISHEVYQDLNEHCQFGDLSQTNEIEDLKLYKCRNCKTCLEINSKLKLHNCPFYLEDRRFCKICKQYFPKNNRRHHNRHKGNIKFNVVIEYFEPVKINRLKNSKIIEKNARKKILNPSNMNTVRFTDTPENGNDEKNTAISVKDSQSAKVAGYDENTEISHEVSQDLNEHCQFDDHSQTNDIENLKLYKCRNCKTCLEIKSKRKLHNCPFYLQSRIFCNICKQYFPRKNRRHHNRHKGNIKFNVVIEYFEPVKINRSKYSKIIGKNARKKILNPSNMNTVRFTDTPENANDEKNTAISVKDSQSVKVAGYDENTEISHEVSQDLNEHCQFDDLSQTNDIGNLKLYKCRNCKTCLEIKSKLKLHNCPFYLQDRHFCKICKQYFPKNNRRHHNRHKGNIKFNVVIEYFEPIRINRLKYSKIIGKNARKKNLNYSNVNTVRYTNAPENVNDAKYSMTSLKHSQSDENISEGNSHSNEVSKDLNEHCRFYDICQPNKIENMELYKCKICKVCIENHENLNIHHCVFNVKYKHFCKICEQYFPIQNRKHQNIHEGNIKYNLDIAYFVPGKMRNYNDSKKKPRFRNRNKTRYVKAPKFINDDGNSVNSDELSQLELSNDVTQLVDEHSQFDAPVFVLFKCKNCNVCIEKKRKTVEHTCHIEYYSRFCDICKEYFPFTSYVRHVVKHKYNKKINIIIRHFQPATVTYSHRSIKKEAKEEILNHERATKRKMVVKNEQTLKNLCINEEFFQNSEDCQSSGKANQIESPQRKIRKLDITDEDPESNVELSNNTQIQSQIESNGSLSLGLALTNVNGFNLPYDVYVCNQCNVHFLSKKNWDMHCKNHSLNRGSASCIRCRLAFPLITLRRHLYFHEEKRTFIRIIDLSNNTAVIYNWTDRVSSAKNKIIPIDAPANVNHKENYENFAKPQPDDKVFRNDENAQISSSIRINDLGDNTEPLYNWSDRVPQTIVMVDCYSGEADAKEDGYFQGDSVTDAKISVHGAELVADEEGSTHRLKAPVSSTDRNEVNLVADEEGSTHRLEAPVSSTDRNEVNLVADEEGSTHHLEAPVSRTDRNEVNIIEISTVSKESTDISEVEVPKDGNTIITDLVYLEAENQNEVPVLKRPSTIEYTTKLFNCSQCDVYFIEEDSYKNHLKNHVALVDKDYIQCKLCLLQFLIMDLHLHMVNHHLTEFDFEKVLVEEYSPNGSRSSLYQLKYKLQSRIVTTTSTEGD